MNFNKDILVIDPVHEVERLSALIHESLFNRFKRKGAVIGVSGGVDSATTLALVVRAIGAENVIAIAMPDQDSNPVSEILGKDIATKFGASFVKEDITPVLISLKCYEHRDSAVRKVFPDYNPDTDGIKLVLPTDLLGKGSLNVYSLALVRNGEEIGRRILPAPVYLEIVAASNMKQRTRMLTLYYHAEKRNYAVIGTANKNEHAQGFFVKYGDGGVDIQPILHLYKTQIYQLAQYLNVPQEIIDRTPTSDTYSAECTQEEFYFRLPFELMDLIWYGFEHEVSPEIVANELNLATKQVENVYRDLAQKARSTEYLRMVPITSNSN